MHVRNRYFKYVSVNLSACTYITIDRWPLIDFPWKHLSGTNAFRGKHSLKRRQKWNQLIYFRSSTRTHVTWSILFLLFLTGNDLSALSYGKYYSHFFLIWINVYYRNRIDKVIWLWVQLRYLFKPAEHLYYLYIWNITSKNKITYFVDFFCAIAYHFKVVINMIPIAFWTYTIYSSLNQLKNIMFSKLKFWQSFQKHPQTFAL